MKIKWENVLIAGAILIVVILAVSINNITVNAVTECLKSNPVAVCEQLKY